VGMFTFRDGSTYEGFWHKGKKHGVGIFRPATAPDMSRMRSLGALTAAAVTRCPLAAAVTACPLTAAVTGCPLAAAVTGCPLMAKKTPPPPHTHTQLGTTHFVSCNLSHIHFV